MHAWSQVNAIGVQEVKGMQGGAAADHEADMIGEQQLKRVEQAMLLVIFNMWVSEWASKWACEWVGE